MRISELQGLSNQETVEGRDPMEMCISYLNWVLNWEDVMFQQQVAAVVAVSMLVSISTIFFNILTINGLWKLEVIPDGTRLLLLNLSAVNFLIGLLGQPLHVAFLLLQINGKPSFYLGKASDTINFGLWMLSFFTLLGVTLERYISIFRPYFHLQLVLGSKLKIIILSIWACAIIISGCYEINCTVSYYVWLIWIIFNAFGCAWIIFAYVRIYCLVYKIKRQARKQEQRLHCPQSPNKKSTNTTAVLAALYVMFYLPYVVILHLKEFSNRKLLNDQMFLWLETLALATSTLDPIIYCLMNKDIRRAVFTWVFGVCTVLRST